MPKLCVSEQTKQRMIQTSVWNGRLVEKIPKLARNELQCVKENIGSYVAANCAHDSWYQVHDVAWAKRTCPNSMQRS